MRISIWIGLAVITALLVAGFNGQVQNGLALEGVEPGHVGTVLASLIFVALLIERVLEVFMPTLVDGSRKEALLADKAILSSRIADAVKAIEEKQSARVAKPELTGQLDIEIASLQRGIDQDRKAEAENSAAIAAVDRRTQSIALSFSIPICLIVALAGVRSINAFLPSGPEGALGPFQKGLFVALDVFLTAGLLAGGADGIHKILDRFIKLATGKEQTAN